MSTDRTAEMLNCLSAISREMGEFRADVNARLDGLETRIGRLESEMREGFAQVRADIRHLKHKLEVLTEDSMELRADQRDLRKRVEMLERTSGITDSV